MKCISVQGYDIPLLGFGTWKLSGADATRAVAFALEQGYTHIDTAQIYENEAEVGEGIKTSGVAREKIFLTTKIWRNHFSAGTVAESLDESLRKLKTEYVDLLLIHWPFPETPVAKMVEALIKVHESGKTRLIGVSNFTVPQMQEALKLSNGAICNNQVEYHPYLSQKPVIEFARAHGITITAYSPVARGKVFTDTALKQIGLAYGKNAGQVALRWLIQQNIIAIPKSATLENILANKDIFDFELSEADMAKLHALASPSGRMVNPDFAPEWDKAA